MIFTQIKDDENDGDNENVNIEGEKERNGVVIAARRGNIYLLFTHHDFDNHDFNTYLSFGFLVVEKYAL